MSDSKYGNYSLGYWDKDPLKSVRNACALIIHYAFEKRKGDETNAMGSRCDVRNLRAILSSRARIFEASFESERLLKMLASGRQIRKNFDLRDGANPDLLLVFVMTHGSDNGHLETDFLNDDGFRMSAVYSALKKNPVLGNALKLIFVHACRGILVDDVVYSKDKFDESILQRGMIRTKRLDKEQPLNVNAVRISTEPNEENFVTVFSSVEGSVSMGTASGTSLITSFLTCLVNLERDVGLDEFLTRVMRESHVALNEEVGSGSTPEVKAFKHRHLTLTRQTLDLSYIPPNLNYEWMSDRRFLVWTRKAHFYVSPGSKDSKLVAKLQNLLWTKFEFEVKQHEYLQWLASAVANKSEDADGCVLICVVAELSKDEKSGEVCAKIDDQKLPIKNVLHKAIGPTTANWIGKPKIFVFLNTADTPTGSSDKVFQIYQKTDFSMQGTIHEGLLTLILPQNLAVQFFIDSLNDLNRPDATFQQFFFDVLRRAQATASIQPMVVSTLAKSLDMTFPPHIVAKNFSLVFGKKRDQISLGTLWKQISDILNVERKQQGAFVISADAGWGKSALADSLYRKAVSEKKKACFVDVREDHEFQKAVDLSNGHRRTCLRKYRQRAMGSHELLVLDNVDSVDQGDNLLSVVHGLAQDDVCLLVCTRPAYADLFRAQLEGVCPVGVVGINGASRAKQTSFLLHRHVAPAAEVLSRLDEASADDLVLKLGSLEHVATFPGLAAWRRDRLFDLCRHVMDATAAQAQRKARSKRSSVDALAALASSFFFDAPLAEGATSDALLEHFAIFRVLGARVVPLSPTLAAYLCVAEGPPLTEQRVSQVQPAIKQQLLRTMWTSSRICQVETTEL